jgi:hypothetical protein
MFLIVLLGSPMTISVLQFSATPPKVKTPQRPPPNGLVQQLLQNHRQCTRMTECDNISAARCLDHAPK